MLLSQIYQYFPSPYPRFSPDGMGVIIDSPHDGMGRQMYLLDISGIVGGKKLY